MTVNSQPRLLSTKQIAFWTAVVMAVFFPVSFAVMNVGAVILMACWVLRKAADIRTQGFRFSVLFFDKHIDAALILFFMTAVLSAAGSSYFQMSLQGIHKLFRYLFLFIAAREVFSERKQMLWIVFAFAAGGGIAAYNGLLQGFLGWDPIRGKSLFLSFQSLVRLTSCFPNPNAFAAYLAMIVPFVSAIWQGGGLRPVLRDILMALLIPMLTALALTYARPAAFALAANFLLLAGLKNKRNWIFLALCGVICFFFLIHSGAREWLVNLNSWKDLFLDTSRHFHHQAAMNMIAYKPFLGMGINTFDVNYASFRAAGDPFSRWSAHQAYLQIAGEMGFVGLAAFFLLMASVLFYVGKIHQKLNEDFGHCLLTAFGGGVLTFFVIGFFESNFWQPRQAYFFWFWAGLWCSAARLLQRNVLDEKKESLYAD